MVLLFVIAWINLCRIAPLYATGAFSLVDFGTSAQMIGTGHIIGFSSGASSIFENPASLSMLSRPSLSSFYVSIMDNEARFYNIALAYPLAIGTLGVGIMVVSVTGIDTTEIDSGTNWYVSSGQIDYTNGLVKLAYGWPLLPSWKAGLTYTYMFSYLGTTQSVASNADIGLMGSIHPLDISFVIRNCISSPMRFNSTQKETVDATYILGARLPISDLNIMAQASSTPEGSILKSIGTQYHPSYLNDLLSLGAGCREVLSEQDVKFVYSVGIGVNLKSLRCHFAYEKSDYLPQDNNYYFSVDMGF